jgi:preprotein translocase subunit SecD
MKDVLRFRYLGGVAVVGALVLTGCGASGSQSHVSTAVPPSTTPAGPVHLYFRPVLCGAPLYSPPPHGGPEPQGGPPPPCSPQVQPGEPTPTDLALASVPSTPPRPDNPLATVLLPQRDKSGTEVARYELGPSVLDSSVIRSATAAVPQNGGSWQVNFTLTSAGSSKLDDLARQYYQRQVAIELDGEVLSAPTINAQSFGGQGQITGDFTEARAKLLAAQIVRQH